ncbi:MAG: response regulator transcription factor [Elusimicrobiales bacterium]|nr:response regulator transcription factor [Elusimicrobiales bacterium]
MKERALIVDDDADLLSILKRYLEKDGFEAVLAADGVKALAAAAAAKPDIIITDVDMPHMDGFTLCRRVKESKALRNTPLIIMSGKKVSEADIVSGYTFGADDYVTKPISYPILMAKAKTLIRRAESRAKPAPLLKKAGLELNLEGRTAKLNGKILKLTSKELDLLAALVSNPGRVLSLTGLLESVWGYNTADYNNPHTVEVHISNLRKKTGSFSKRIIAVPGHGYKFE